MRNPIEDPQPGDVLEAEVTLDQLHVHFRRGDEVYCGRWTKDGKSMGCVRGSIEQFRESCIVAGAKVIQRSEDCPPEFIAALTGRSEAPDAH